MSSIKKLIQSAPMMRNSVPTNAAIKNSQKATTYVGKGVLRKGGKITPVPNGPLVKKNGSTLKKGGKIKKAQHGFIDDGWWGNDNEPTTKKRRDSFNYWKNTYDANLKNNNEVLKNSTKGKRPVTAEEKSKLKPTLPALQGMRRNSNFTPKQKNGGKLKSKYKK